MIGDEYGDVNSIYVSTYSENEKPNGVKKWSLQVQTQKPSFQFLLKTVSEEFIALKPMLTGRAGRQAIR